MGAELLEHANAIVDSLIEKGLAERYPELRELAIAIRKAKLPEREVVYKATSERAPVWLAKVGRTDSDAEFYNALDEIRSCADAYWHEDFRVWTVRSQPPSNTLINWERIL